MIHELHEMLARVRNRLRRMHVWKSLALTWLVWALVAWVAWALPSDVVLPWGTVAWAIATAALVTAIVGATLAARASRDPHWVAQRIEARHPDLGAALLAALELAPSPRFRRLGYLQSSVVKEAIEHGHRHNWSDTVSRQRLWLVQIAQLASLALLIVACALLVNRQNALALINPSSQDDAIRDLATEVNIQPGNTEIERGNTLLVIAEFGAYVPQEVELVYQPSGKPTDEKQAESNEQEEIRAMTRSLDDPKFVGRVAAVNEDLIYSVRFGDKESAEYRVTVFDYPELQRADAHLQYPEYTELEPKVIEDIRHVTAVEGTELTLRCRLNKEVSSARLMDRNGEEIAMSRTDEQAPVYSASWPLEKSQRYKLYLEDAEGRENKFPPELVINVTPNHMPELKINQPARDVRVSPLEELDVAGEVSDDFGLVRYGLSYSLGGTEPAEMVLYDRSEEESTLKRQQLSRMIAFESLDAEPDQLLSYYVWAEDIGPDGEIRQSMSDMYFAEVRHFEEIFREGEQPTQQQMQEMQQQGSQAGQQAEELAELQKQIVNATWSLIRRETSAEPSPKFRDDVEVIADSQQQAITKLEELAEQVTDDQSLQYVEQARMAMQSVHTELTNVLEQSLIPGLRPALAAGQSAYQSLLKLRAREFDIVQGGQQSMGGAAGGGGRAQRQLDQLELSADENRYETQSRAMDSRQASQEGQEQAREMLDRLRELARRQEDLNERVRELQSALEAAQSQAERERIERELKRLRDQQQQILRDTDQLQNEMQNSPERQQNEDIQQRMEETRSRVQQASEALEEGRLSEAVTEGARAGRQLDQMRDEFRRRTADRFSEEMRQMRDTARQLEQRQQELGDQLAQQNQTENRSLRDGGSREQILEGLEQQKQQYEQLLEEMRQTVQEAEEPEPLLAQQLYDSVRQASDNQIDRALDLSRELLEMGIPEDAGQAMNAANEGLQQLRQQVDQAAESVLGDETEALRRAERELDELSEQLNEEIARAQGRQSDGSQPDGQQPQERSDQSQGESQGNRPSEENRDQPGARGENQPGENQPGENQLGENQPSGEAQSDGQPSDSQQEGQQQSSDQSQQQGQQQGGQQGGAGQSDQPRDSQNESNRGSSPSTVNPEGMDNQNQNQQQPEGSGGRGEFRQGGRLTGGGGGSEEEFSGDFDDLFEEMAEPGGPITGEEFRQWNDRLRDVQDLLDDPQLSAEVARISDRAEAARAEYKRHAAEPDWDRLIDMVAEPMGELRLRIVDEIRRKESPDALVPIDRDPVPEEYVEKVRLYYEQLGSGE